MAHHCMRPHLGEHVQCQRSRPASMASRMHDQVIRNGCVLAAHAANARPLQAPSCLSALQTWSVCVSGKSEGRCRQSMPPQIMQSSQTACIQLVHVTRYAGSHWLL